MEQNQILRFPLLKERLLNQLELAMSEQRDEDVVRFSDELIRHGFADKHVYLGKIKALIAMKQWEDAKDFTEYVMGLSENFYQRSISYYLLILHEAHIFQELIDVYDSALAKGCIAEDDDVLVELYESAKHLLEVEFRQQIRKLERARNVGDHLMQAQTLSRMRTMGYSDLTSLYSFLSDTYVHPVVKTEILHLAKDLDLDELIEVEKFGQVMTVVPNQMSSIKEQDSYESVLLKLSDIQQQDPVQFEWLGLLFYQYCFVIYPLIVQKDEIGVIVEALIHLGESHLNITEKQDALKSSVKRYVKEIEICHEMYIQIYDSH